MRNIIIKINSSLIFSNSKNTRNKFSMITIIMIYFSLWIIGLYLGRLTYSLVVDILVDKLQVDIGIAGAMRKIIVCSVQILTFFIWVRLYEKRNFKTMGFIAKKPILKFLFGMIIGVLIISIIVVTLFYLNVLKFKGLNQCSSVIYILIIFSWFIQSSAEEIAIRGWLIPSIGNVKSPVLSIVVTSLIFGVLHLFTSGVTFLSFFNLIISGVLFALIAIYTESIWCGLGIHFMWNMTLGNVFGLPVSGFKEYGESIFTVYISSNSILTGGNFGPEGGLVTTILLTIGILIILYKLNRKY